jgi:putative component of toxin-antitoxin plasmid stabilization module
MYLMGYKKLMPSLHQIRLLETDEGDIPFEEWYFALKDKIVKVRIRRRLDRLELGNFGDTESVGERIYGTKTSFWCWISNLFY